jgi:hypothetical protein
LGKESERPTEDKEERERQGRVSRNTALRIEKEPASFHGKRL